MCEWVIFFIVLWNHFYSSSCYIAINAIKIHPFQFPFISSPKTSHVGVTGWKLKDSDFPPFKRSHVTNDCWDKYGCLHLSLSYGLLSSWVWCQRYGVTKHQHVLTRFGRNKRHYVGFGNFAFRNRSRKLVITSSLQLPHHRIVTIFVNGFWR